MRPLIRVLILILVLVGLLAACGAPPNVIILVTATPVVTQGEIGGGGLSGGAIAPEGGGIAPTLAPTPTFIPTPNPTRSAVLDVTQDQLYTVQHGDTLSLIGIRFGVGVPSILEANALTEDTVIYPGQVLIIPQTVAALGPSFKIIPDSELIMGPALRDFSVAQFLVGRNSYLGVYTEELDGRLWTGAEIVERVALEQSVSPRLLIALLEYETQWMSKPMIDQTAALYPMNYFDQPAQIYGLYRQLDWAGKVLNTGYYGWKQRGMSATLLKDGMRAGLDQTVNAGTAGVQVLLSQTRVLNSWLGAVHHSGFFSTYVSLFGDPFQYAVEPLIPADLTQPEMAFPWADDETWYYTGGPHGGWGSGSAWAALDFVTGEELIGCETSPAFATAVADGVIARSEWGIVVLDLDGDGYEGTGWTVFYLHLATEGRQVVEGQQVRQGDPIGRPSCEGGISWATHLHIGRRYNGEWIAADCTECYLTTASPQLNFDGWYAYSFQSEYDGSLIKGEEYREACTCRAPLNTLTRPD